MSTHNEQKITKLLNSTPTGVVLSTSWLASEGYSLDLQKRYRRSGWLESVGTGAMVRKGDTVDYLGGVYAVQQQLGNHIHPAGKTALALHGKLHYLELSPKKVVLFGGGKDSMPNWFRNRSWGVGIEYHKSTFLPPELGLVEHKHLSFSVKISSPGRAIMECLYLAPKNQPLLEVYELMQGLNNLRPSTVNELLNHCSSVKVKRLFLYLAEKAGHDWVTYLDTSKLDLGAGNRYFATSDGVYVSKYQITVPRELEIKHE